MTMDKRTGSLIIYGLIIFLLLIGGGCASAPVDVAPATVPATSAAVSDKTPEPDQSRGAAASLPEEMKAYTASLARIRPDAAAVLQALFYRLQGSDTTDMGPVRFDRGVGPLTDGTGVSFKKFILRKISIRRDAAGSDNPLHRRITAVFEMADVLGRRAFVNIAADYLIEDDVLLVRQAAALPVYPQVSDVRFMVVPAKRLPSLKILARLTFSELFTIVAENAYTREELAQQKAGNYGPCKIVAFNMVRAEKGDKLKIFISEKDSRGRAVGKNTLSNNENGWTSAVVEGEFEFNSAPQYLFYVGLSDDEKTNDVEMLGSFGSIAAP